MMRLYYSIFHDYGMRCAQVLATKRDFSTGRHRENMINCYEGLLLQGIIPIANEYDAVSLSMSMFSDNDELASLVAELTISTDKLHHRGSLGLPQLVTNKYYVCGDGQLRV